MISEITKTELPAILNVINDAAFRYKGMIPNDCWHEPYMSEQELINELADGIRMFGCHENNFLVGVMGIQELSGVTLIRHAYTLLDYQGIGIGKSLLQYLFKINKNFTLLVGTWRDALWAIRFYENNGFVLHHKQKSEQLLEKYWKVPLKQMENSVVLEKQSI